MSKMENLVNNKKASIMITINDDIGFKSIDTLKQISLINKNIKITSINNINTKNNFYYYNLTDNINTLNKCNSIGFLFASNPKVECPIINVRLRTKTRNSLLVLHSLCQNFDYNIRIKFINLNFSKSLTIFEGIYPKLSKNFLKAFSPLIFIGENFGKRGINITNFINSLKQKFKTIKIIKINETTNSESLYFFNIKNKKKKDYKNFNSLFCINLDDDYTLRKLFFKFEKKII
jgi:hypothetical protein